MDGNTSAEDPLDAWIYQEILFEVRPKTVIELGNAFGGTTLFIANMLDLLGEGQVIAVDHRHERFEAEHPRIVKVTGDTQAVVGLVEETCEGATL